MTTWRPRNRRDLAFPRNIPANEEKCGEWKMDRDIKEAKRKRWMEGREEEAKERKNILTRRDHSGGFVKLFNGKRRVRLLAFVYRWDLSTRSHPPPCFHRSARSSGGKGAVNNSSLSRRIKLRRKEGTCLRHGVFVENGWALGNNKKEALRIDSRVTMILFFFFFDSFNVFLLRQLCAKVWQKRVKIPSFLPSKSN